MSSKSEPPFLGSVAFRLTILYAVISTVSLLAVLTVSYLGLRSTLQLRLDEELVNEIEEYRLLLGSQNVDVLQDVLDREAMSEGTSTLFFRVFHKSGTEIISTDMSAWGDIELNRPNLMAAAGGDVVLETHRHESRAYPVQIVYGPVGGDLVMQLGESTAANAEILHNFRRIGVLGMLAFVCCSVGLGWVMARRALSGVRRVTQTARNISSGAWDSRVPVSPRHDEIDELALSFNDMVGRVTVLIRELKEVTDDIAHDLRTPVARMRAAAETVLSGPDGDTGREEVAGQVVEDCDQLLDLINTMLEISQTEAGARRLECDRLDLSSIVEDVCDLFRPAAEDKGVAFTCASKPGISVNGDAKRLARAIAHVVDNAVKYTEPEGHVEVACTVEGHRAAVSVRDTGPGIASENQERVFSRFYRADKSRSQSGNGLGLSLSRAILRAHGGDVTVTSELGQGSTFVLTLPANE